MAQAQDNGSKQAAGQHVEEPPSGQSAQELLDAWYASVQQELEGADADVCVWDPKATWTISAATQHQNVDHTPYEGFECHGRAHLVFVNGDLAARDGEPTGAMPGRYVAR